MTKRRASATVDLKVRMKEPLRAALERAARNHGLSMNAEAVDRLERSFQREDLLTEALTLAYGADIAILLTLMGEAMKDTARSAGVLSLGFMEGPDNWRADPYVYDQVAKAAAYIVEHLRPEGEIKIPPTPPGSGFVPNPRHIGSNTAGYIVSRREGAGTRKKGK